MSTLPHLREDVEDDVGGGRLHVGVGDVGRGALARGLALAGAVSHGCWWEGGRRAGGERGQLRNLWPLHFRFDDLRPSMLQPFSDFSEKSLIFIKRARIDLLSYYVLRS